MRKNNRQYSLYILIFLVSSTIFACTNQDSTTQQSNGDNDCLEIDDPIHNEDGDNETAIEYELEKDIDLEREFALEADSEIENIETDSEPESESDIDLDFDHEIEHAAEMDNDTEAEIDNDTEAEIDKDSYEYESDEDEESTDEDSNCLGFEIGSVIFNEIMAFPLALSQNEGQWLELYNTSDKSIDLNGCSLEIDDFSSQIEEELVIGPYGYLVFTIKRLSQYPNDVHSDWTWGDRRISPNESTSTVILKCNGCLIDSTTHSDNIYPFNYIWGSSVALCPRNADSISNDDPINWAQPYASMLNGDRGTPGELNEECNTVFPDGDNEMEALQEIDKEFTELDFDTANCDFAAGAVNVPNCGRYVQVGSDEQAVLHETCIVVPQEECHSFFMGTDSSQNQCPEGSPDEYPQHLVNLTSYSMSREPVTIQEYRLCMNAGICSSPVNNVCRIPSSPSIVEANIENDTLLSHPVNCVTRYQARIFCDWINGELPTEAQWEYAVEGPMDSSGTMRCFPWGNSQEECHANIWGEDPFSETSPVGFFDGSLKSREEGGWSFGPDHYQTCNDESPFGLKDTTHNLSEFVLDLFYDYTSQPGSPPLNPLNLDGPGFASRGSSWYHSEIRHTRAQMRNDLSTIPDGISEADSGTGFRCAFPVNIK